MRLVPLLGSVWLVLGCSMAVDVFPLQGASRDPLPGGCEVRFFRSPRGPGAHCSLIAKVRVRDTGYATRCDSDHVRDEVRGAACEVGGDAVVLQRVSADPSAWGRGSEMSCVEADADVYRCGASE